MKTQKITRVLRFCLPALVIAVSGAMPLAAQETSDVPSLVVLEKNQPAESTAAPTTSIEENPKPKRFSWKAEPLPKCKAFLITDFGIGYNLLAPKYSEPGENIYLNGDFGFMVNRNEHSARGLILSFGATGFGQGTTLRAGLKTRFRRWLGERSSLDLSPGLVYNFWSDGIQRTGGAVGISGQAGLNFSWLGLTGLLEIIPGGRTEYSYSFDPAGGFQEQRKRKTDVSFYLGVKMGEKQGTIIAVACGALIGLGALAFSGGFSPGLSFQ